METDNGKEKKKIVAYDPHGLKKGIKEKILDEDTYVKGMEKIITRDFFPDLERLEAHSEYLDAVEKKDFSKIRMLENKYSVLCQRDSETPAMSCFGTPLSSIREDDTSSINGRKSKNEKKPTHNPAAKDASDLSLDGFLATHTSEDNAAFAEIIADVESRRKEKMAWCYEAEAKADEIMGTIAGTGGEKSQLAIESGPSTSTDKTKGLALVKSDSAVGTKDPAESSKSQDRESTAPDSWPGYRVHNSVLFVPPGVPFTAEELAQRSADAAARKIVHTNTHLPGLLPGEAEGENARVRRAIEAAKAQRTAVAQLQGRVGPDGKDLFPSGVTPAVRGYSFMAATPSPMPDAIPESPLMTWGEVEGTPFALDEARVATPLPGAGFKIPAVPQRDKLALELAEEAHRRHRGEKTAAIKRLRGRLASPASSVSSSSSVAARLASLSPAARKLSAKIGRPSSGFQLTPDTRAKTKKTRKTPLVRTPGTPATPSSAHSLTSGLLDLTKSVSKRPKH